MKPKYHLLLTFFFTSFISSIDLAFTGGARATTLTVNNTSDSGTGSLRDTVAAANSGDTIIFASSLSGQTITLTSGPIELSNNITIDASSLSSRIQINGNHSSRAFLVDPGVDAGLNFLTVTNCFNSIIGGGGGIRVGSGATLIAKDCSLSSNFGYGGGIYNGGTATLNNCIVSGNSGPESGGIVNRGNLMLYDCTFSDNAVSGSGGGVNNSGNLTLNDCTFFENSATNGSGGGIYNGGSATLNNCTVSGNSGYVAGGVYNSYGSGLTVTNTIVSGNMATTDPNIYGVFSGVDNLINGDPLLAPLGDYGGPTPTMPPLTGSPAIDAGDDSVTSFLAADQRGYPRKFGAHVDIGAVELQGVIAGSASQLLTPTVQFGGSLTFDFTNVADAEFTILTSTNLAQPLSQWSSLGLATQSSPGQYQFTDPNAANDPQRFYQVVSP